ncbi:hypothetical protein [Brevibacillus sp. SYSU BS000544]|uniref:hypothetical protein n=1 Tax=Brevibacillus sp. SYSU BS000544 TaxID=3416443 RepID=UPI003CE46D1B
MASFRLLAKCLIAVCLLITGCTQTTTPPNPAPQITEKFDPENKLEYGMMGVYLGQGIKEAMDQLKPTQYEFMDAVSRESLTVEQLARGEGTVSTGMIMIGKAQIIMKVRNGVVESLMTGGMSEEEGKTIKTNRGVAVYDGVDKVKQAYGETQGDKELIFKGSTYQMLFSIHNGKVLGYRFDLVK